MSETQTIDDQIQAFILEKFPLARKRTFGSEVPLLESGIIDSMGILDLVSYLERQFHITVGDEELVPENFRTTRAVAEFIATRQSGAGESGGLTPAAIKS